MGTVLYLLMVVKSDWGLSAVAAGFLCGFAQGMQTGFDCADSGEQSDDSEYYDNP
jgi:hypothetical protein